MKHLIRSIISSAGLCSVLLLGHGFTADTLVHNFGIRPSTIKTICSKIALGTKQHVSCWDSVQDTWNSARVRAIGHAHINCAITIGFDADRQHDVTCSPSQSFYNVTSKCWTPAYQLQHGDRLLTESETSVNVHRLAYHKAPTTVYLLEVKKTHTFCVGHYRVLTHNTPLAYGVMLGLSGTFGAGAAAGGAAGSFFGPITCIGGLIIGGLISLGASCLFGRGKIPQYHMMFNTREIERTIDQHCLDDFTYAQRDSLLIIQEPSRGTTHVYPILPPEDVKHTSCGYIYPPEVDIISCGQPPEHIVTSRLPTGCGGIQAELGNTSEQIVCYPGVLIHIQENEQNSAPPVKAIEDIVQECRPGRETRGPSEQFEKDGGFEQAEKDFENLGPTNIVLIPKGKVGKLSDGRTANVRTDSSAKKPTLEVYDPETGQSIKIRYQ